MKRFLFSFFIIVLLLGVAPLLSAQEDDSEAFPTLVIDIPGLVESIDEEAGTITINGVTILVNFDTLPDDLELSEGTPLIVSGTLLEDGTILANLIVQVSLEELEQGDDDGEQSDDDDADEEGDEDEGDEDDADTLVICHYPPGNPSEQHSITIDADAWDAHAGHGDSEGFCEGDDEDDLVEDEDDADDDEDEGDEDDDEENDEDSDACGFVAEASEGDADDDNSGNCHPVLDVLSLAFEVPYAELQALRDDDYGVGEIARLYLLAEEAGEDVDAIIEMRDSGMGWGQIMREFPDVHPSDLAPGRVIVLGNGRGDSIDDDLLDDDNVEVLNNRPGNGNGNGPGNANGNRNGNRNGNGPGNGNGGNRGNDGGGNGNGNGPGGGNGNGNGNRNG